MASHGESKTSEPTTSLDQSRSGYDKTGVQGTNPPSTSSRSEYDTSRSRPHQRRAVQRSVTDYFMLSMMVVGVLITLIMWIPLGN
ncbi:hypothetical protein F4819DRAFT_485560 [Hypoxylon fuscum]|nr:hypothetical protein F4819DRAFT_485560 [Hypoxylon fuscum]